MATVTMAALDDRDMAKFLDQRYGDGLVYFKEPNDRALYGLAMRLGFVSEQGYLTTAGKHFWAAWI